MTCLSCQVGPNGKKVIASFNCDMSDYAGIPNTR